MSRRLLSKDPRNRRRRRARRNRLTQDEIDAITAAVFADRHQKPFLSVLMMRSRPLREAGWG